MSRMRIFWTYVIKSISYLFLFAFFHFIHDLVPNTFTQAISGTNESMFQHMKMGFLSYSIVSVFEYLINKKWVSKIDQFISSRVLATTFLPWFIFIIWYIIPAIMNKPMPNLAIELTYSILITILAGVVAILFERNFENIDFTKPARILIYALYLGLLFLLVIFSFRFPLEGFFS
jgi:uncharacterized membrane protein